MLPARRPRAALVPDVPAVPLPAPLAAPLLAGVGTRAAMASLLRRALRDDRLRLHHQPVVDVEDGRVLGSEALLRVVDEDGSLLLPGQLVAVAEQSELIVEVGTWVLGEACRQLARTPAPLTLAVNVSARQVAQPGFATTVLAALRQAGADPARLVLELTETASLEAAPSTTVRGLQALRSAGVTLALDDFGAGWAPLRALRALPVSMLKVDRAFVAGLPDDRTDLALVGAVLDLSRTLGLTCVVEGVETPDQLLALRGLGARQAQGYLLSRPVPAPALESLWGRRLVPAGLVPAPR